jgi:hypothetical protein
MFCAARRTVPGASSSTRGTTEYRRPWSTGGHELQAEFGKGEFALGYYDGVAHPAEATEVDHERLR